jgi:hypothetical protein
MKAKLLGGFAVALNDVGISLYLRGTQLRPELDNLLAGCLDIGHATVVLLVDTGEF